MYPALPLRLILTSLPLAALWTVGVDRFLPIGSLNLKFHLATNPAVAQSVVPEPNSTNTLVNPAGNRIDITGGQRSGDGGNLFHSFTQFNVDSGQIVNFISNPSIQNILTRVSGGEASLINGLIQVTGGNSNLFLMNPAGIVFGENARLDVPAAFTATTATGIGFNSNSFNASGENNYATLVGNPNLFTFLTANSGHIINEGELTVKSGQTLMLIGGNILNTGTLSAPGGLITIAAVENNNRVRISQEGHLLNLELEAVAVSEAQKQTIINPLALPELLTGTGTIEQASTVNILADGTLRLSAANANLPPSGGMAIVSGNINTASPNLTAAFSNFPQVNIIANNIRLTNANIDASALNGGGMIRIGGDNQGNFFPTASITLIDNQSILRADGLQGGNGGVVIIGSNNFTQFFGSISAQGTSSNSTSEGLGGTAQIFSDNNLNVTGSVNLKGSNGSLGTLEINSREININNNPEQNNNNQPGNQTLTEQTLENLANNANLILAAKENITIANLADNELRFPATNGTLTFTADADQTGGGAFNMNSGDTLRTAGAGILITGVNILTGNLITQGGDLTLTSRNNGGINTGNLSTSALTSGGNLLLTSDRDLIIGSISTNAINNGIGGNVNLVALNRITTENMNTSGSLGGGNISINSAQGDIFLNGESYSIDATSNRGSGGNVIIGTPRHFRANLIDSRGRETGGNIILNAELEVEAQGLRTGTFETTTNPVQTGDIQITSDEINLTGGKNSVQGNNQIILQPATLAQDIEIAGQADNSASSLNLTREDLESLQNGFSEIILGNSEGRGTIFITGDISFQDPILIQSPQGNITSGTFFREQPYTITGLENASIRLLALDNIRIGNILTDGQDISLSSQSGTISAGQLSTGNNPAATLRLIGSEINLLGGLNSVEGLGTVVLQPSSNNQGITLSGTSENTSDLDLSPTDLDALANGFSMIKIGRFDSVSPLLIAGEISFRDPVLLQAQSISGSSTLTGIDNASVTLSTPGDLRVGNIITQGQPIQLTSSQGQIRTGVLQTISPTGERGAINLSALNNIEIGTVQALSEPSNLPNQIAGGEINIMSRNGTLTVNGRMASSVQMGDNLAIELFASGNVSLGDIIANRGINLTSSTGGIVTGNLQTSDNITLNSGITLNGYTGVKTNNINTNTTAGVSSPIQLNSETGIIQAGDLNSSGISGGGNIVIKAGDRISTGRIDSSSTESQAGNVALNSRQDINITSIRAEGGTQGGDIGILTNGFFRATGIFTTANQINASISSQGGEQGGAIVIQQGQDYCATSACENTAFIVGNSSINGTAGAITDGDSVTILPPLNNLGNPTTPSPNNNTTSPPNSNSPLANQINSELQTTPSSSTPEPNSVPILTNSTVDSSSNALVESSTIIQPSEELTEQPVTPTEAPIIPLNSPTIPNDQISSGSVISSLSQIEAFRGIEFTNYFGGAINKNPVNNQNIRQTLNDISQLTGYKPAIVYVSATKTQLEVRVILPEGQPLFKSIPVSREEVLKTVREFSNQIRMPQNLKDTQYKENGKKLYDWLITPLQPQLEQENIKTLIFSMDSGLRTLPLAALYDGKQFLLEQYSLGLIPSLSLTDTRYVNINNSKVLAMGASIFPNSNQQPLPAVPVELNLILDQNLGRGESFLNEKFTIDNLKEQRSQHQFQIVHLATHGEFQTGGAEQSYIQFWDQKLRLNELRNLRLHQPPVELLVLSACTTAVGDEKAELGFAGLAVQAGVKSALASLWYVSDAGTLGLMNTFYEALSKSPIKAEALRQAQLAMLYGKVRLQNGYLIDETDILPKKIPLPSEIAARGNVDLSHPFYWAGFTMIGSPW